MSLTGATLLQFMSCSFMRTQVRGFLMTLRQGRGKKNKSKEKHHYVNERLALQRCTALQKHTQLRARWQSRNAKKGVASVRRECVTETSAGGTVEWISEMS